MAKISDFWGHFEMKLFGLVWAFYVFLGFYTVTPFIIHKAADFWGSSGFFRGWYNIGTILGSLLWN